MAGKSVSRSVLFYKRMIAATLAVIILALAGLSIYFARRLARVSGELADARGELFEAAQRDAERLAEEEAEKLRNAIPPEQTKPAGEADAAEILAGSTVVAHALGAVDDLEGLNCLEGFQERYDAGVRVFEVDLRMTSDGHVVLRHDWLGGLQEGIDNTAIPTLEEFLSKPIYGIYTPLSFRDLLHLMARYPDVCIITDTKFTDAEPTTEQFRAMVDDAHSLGLTYLFDRMIIQVYSPTHFAVVDGVYHFPHYIYTLYQDYFGQTEESFRNKAVFCKENGIMGLTLGVEVWDADYAPIADWWGVKVYVHTVNDADEAKGLLRTGVRAVYSDTLGPMDIAT